MARNSNTRPSARANRAAQVTARLPGDGLAHLASHAMSRLRAERGCGDISEEARTCMKDPVATALATALCDDDSETADLIVSDLIEAGVPIADVCLEHLAPAARYLGEWWEADRLPFTEVTMATARIQSMLRRMPARVDVRTCAGAKGAVFCAVPGEEHTLGVMMAADLFRRNGWDVSLLVGLDHAEMIARLQRDDRRVVGLSCSGGHTLEALDRLMTELRSARPDARLVLSGRVAEDAAALARLPAPDAVVTTMEEAEIHMTRLAAEIAPARRTERREHASVA